MAQGVDASEKFLSLVAVLPGALQSFWQSWGPLGGSHGQHRHMHGTHLDILQSHI